MGPECGPPAHGHAHCASLSQAAPVVLKASWQQLPDEPPGQEGAPKAGRGPGWALTWAQPHVGPLKGVAVSLSPLLLFACSWREGAVSVCVGYCSRADMRQVVTLQSFCETSACHLHPSGVQSPKASLWRGSHSSPSGLWPGGAPEAGVTALPALSPLPILRQLSWGQLRAWQGEDGAVSASPPPPPDGPSHLTPRLLSLTSV